MRWVKGRIMKLIGILYCFGDYILGGLQGYK